MSEEKQSVLEQATAVVGRTAVYPDAGLGTKRAVEYVTLGLCGEAGELANKVKKILRGDYPSATHPDVYNKLIEELGDVAWYFIAFCKELGQPPERVLKRMMEKVTDRAARGVTKGEGDER